MVAFQRLVGEVGDVFDLPDRPGALEDAPGQRLGIAGRPGHGLHPPGHARRSQQGVAVERAPALHAAQPAAHVAQRRGRHRAGMAPE